MKIRITNLDKLFSRYVRLMSGGYCKRCGKLFGYNRLNNAHFFGRIRHTVRWDIRNTAPLCAECHYWIDVNPLAKTSFFVSILSKEDVADLQRLSNMTTKDYPIDKEALKEDFTEKIRRLEDE